MLTVSQSYINILYHIFRQKSSLERNKIFILLRSGFTLCLVLVFIVPYFFFNVSAAAPPVPLNFVDYITSYTIVDANTVNVSLEHFPYILNVQNLDTLYSNEVYTAPLSVTLTPGDYQIKCYVFCDYARGVFSGLSLSNVPKGSYLTGSFSVESSLPVDFGSEILKSVYRDSSDVNTYIVQTEQYPVGTFIWQDIISPVADDMVLYYLGTLNFAVDSTSDFEFSVNDICLTLNISALQWQAIQDEKSQKLLEDVHKNLEEIKEGQKHYGEQIEAVLDKEKAEANQTGNSSVSGVISGIPDKGKEFQAAIKQFASSAQYEGTEAKLPIPAVKMPEIPGLVPSTTLMEGQELDFEQYINLIPTPLLTLVRCFMTVGLIIYCFKELYDTIQYVLTLRGGGSQ